MNLGEGAYSATVAVDSWEERDWTNVVRGAVNEACKDFIGGFGEVCHSMISGECFFR
jgi:hypothetical protein